MNGYPLLLDVSLRLVVIVGGGAVAVRKAQGLLAAGAKRIRCVSIEFDVRMPGEVERLAEGFRPEHLHGAGLAFAATSSAEVNDQVVQECRRRGILVNRADSDEEWAGDFTVPAVWRGEAVTVAVSAGGSPALAAKIRDDLGKKIEPLQVQMAEAMGVLRPLMKERMGPERRREAFRELAGSEALRVLGERGAQGLMAWLGERYSEMKG